MRWKPVLLRISYEIVSTPMKINERESSHVISHADSDNNITQGSASAGDLGVNWHHEHGISSWFITPMEMDVFRSPSLVMLPAWKE